MEVEPKLEPELEPQVSGDAFGATEVSGVEVSAEVSEAMELAEVVSEVAGVSGVCEVSGLATSDFDSVMELSLVSLVSPPLTLIVLTTPPRSQSSMARRHLSHLSMPWKHRALMERAHLRQLSR